MTVPVRGSLAATLRGVMLIARGRAEGLNCFGDSPRAFLISLMPGLGFILAGVAEGVAAGDGGRWVGEMLMPVCALLAPAVLSYELARLWGRDAFWGRYIVAFTWCQWLLPVVASLGLALLVALRLATPGGLRLLILVLAGYALWMNWFLSRHALALGIGRAACFVLAVNAGTMLLAFGPTLLAPSAP